MKYVSISRLLIVISLQILVLGCIVVHKEFPSSQETRIETDIEMVRRAIADVRSIGIAFDSYAVDNNLYPTMKESEMSIGDFSLGQIRTVAEELRFYNRALPKEDPWESPYLFWSDGQNYAIVCLGSDKILTQAAKLEELLNAIARRGEPVLSRYHCIEDEIVFANGTMVWWPKDPIQLCGNKAKNAGS